MKKLFIPVLAVMLAVGGAYASNRFATGYFAAGDDTCSGSFDIEAPCTLGTDEVCTDVNNDIYYQKAEPSLPTSPSNPCTEVIRLAQ